MGILKAIMPDGTEEEREIGRHTLYHFGLAALRDKRWVLVSVHREFTTADTKRRRLSRVYSADKGQSPVERLKVVPILAENENHSQSSTKLNESAVS